MLKGAHAAVAECFPKGVCCCASDWQMSVPSYTLCPLPGNRGQANSLVTHVLAS